VGGGAWGGGKAAGGALGFLSEVAQRPARPRRQQPAQEGGQPAARWRRARRRARGGGPARTQRRAWHPRRQPARQALRAPRASLFILKLCARAQRRAHLPLAHWGGGYYIVGVGRGGVFARFLIPFHPLSFPLILFRHFTPFVRFFAGAR